MSREIKRQREIHWVYHPLLDGYGPVPEDPLVEKAHRLRECGITIVIDIVRQEGMGIVHLLEWLEPTTDSPPQS